MNMKSIEVSKSLFRTFYLDIKGWKWINALLVSAILQRKPPTPQLDHEKMSMLKF